MDRVEVPRHGGDVVLAPAEPDVGLPAARFRLQPGPVGDQLAVAPVDLRGVAADAMRRIQ
jgi:hypothetical protein